MELCLQLAHLGQAPLTSISRAIAMKRQGDKWCVFLINPLGLTPLWPFCLALPEAVTLVFHLSVIIKSFPFVLSDFGNPRIMVMIYHCKPSNGLPLCWGENTISSQNLQDPVWSHSVCLSPILSPDFPSTSCAPDTVTRLLSNPQVEQTWFYLWHWHVLLPLQEGLPSGFSWLLSSQPWDSSWGLTPWKCHYWLSHLKNAPFCCTAFTVLSSFTALVTQDELIYSFLCVRWTRM